MTATKRARSVNGDDRVALLLLSLLAFGLRVYHLTFQSLWRDEVDSIRFASRALPELLGMFTRPGENGPLFFAGLRLWLAVAGNGEFALRYQAVLAGVLAVPLSYMLARRLVAVGSNGAWQFPCGLTLSNAPLIAALLIAAGPYLVWYSQEGKMYALLTALVLAACLAFLKAVEEGRWWQWLLYLALLAALALTHVLALLLVAVNVLWLALLWPRYRRRWLALALVLLLPLIPFFRLAGWWQLTLLLNPDFQTGHPFIPLSRLVEGLASGYLNGLGALANPWLITPAVFLILAGMAFAGRPAEDARAGQPPITPGRRQRLLPSLMMLVWLLLPPALLFLLSLSKPLYTDRYVIWIAPAFAILIAQGVAGLRIVWRPLGWAAMVGLLALGLSGVWRQSHQPIKADMRAAAAYVRQHRQPGDRILFQMPYIRHTFEYYAGPQDGAIDGSYTNNGSSPDQVADELRAALDGAPAAWLVLSEETAWDERGLVRNWLEENGVRNDAQEFNRVRVVRIVLT
ncbi:MAG: glycosyltransferase family 39 protein [Caldilineales bacterium]